MTKRKKQIETEKSREELCIELVASFIMHFGPYMKSLDKLSFEECRDFMVDWYHFAQNTFKARSYRHIHGLAKVEDLQEAKKALDLIVKRVNKIKKESAQTQIRANEKIDFCKRELKEAERVSIFHKERFQDERLVLGGTIAKTRIALTDGKIPPFIHLHNQAKFAILQIASMALANDKLKLQIADTGKDSVISADWQTSGATQEVSS